ncbi:MAG: histidine phosphatase family protein [Bacteroidia bacterium]|nr:histidine phosphatase family protein [Bacteroidia bacterium]
MKTVVFCRHAKSAWPDDTMDLHRPLKERGIIDANYLGQLLGNQRFEPDLIISSPATRARQTADIMVDRLAYKGEIRTERSIYYEEVGAMMSMIQELPDEISKVMVFGHNPTMENMVRFLLQMDAPFEMPTSAMACIESMSNNWQYFSPRNVSLRWLLVPRLQRRDQL